METRDGGIRITTRPEDWLASGGAMGALVRSMDWTQTPLGPIESWPQSLRTTVSLCLASNFPISLAWGPKHIQIYNDGYWPICGGKHPNAMGQDFRECWASAWPVIGAAFERALAGETSYLENQRMFLDRNGYLEETFFTFSFSPIRDETGGVGGLFHPVTETTSRMLSERRTRLVRDLAARVGKARTTEDVLILTAQTLAADDLDLPFVLLYTIDAAGHAGRLVGSTGLDPGTVASPEVIDLTHPASAWPLADVVRSGMVVQVDNLEATCGLLSCGPYSESPATALALPITVPGSDRPAGVFIAGVSARLPLNEVYRGFYDQLAATVTVAMANARAYEEERERAEVLAELDRAKTAFFSNVSHEFRTPLTLLLSPIEEILTREGGEASIVSVEREEMELVRRNALRLLKLVNTLLDFSRLEAGRVQAVYEPTDLAAYTAELASGFRSAVERTGLALVVDCPELSDPVLVDRSLWEQVVLNLLSNALKHTFTGEITVRVQARTVDGERCAELAVHDTGVGIVADHLPQLFDRFHRVPGARSRSHEGTGIGLALVQEIVKLHRGTILVTSEVDVGTTFTVCLPFAPGPDQADSPSEPTTPARVTRGTSAFIEEAGHWLASDPLSELSAITDAGVTGDQTEPGAVPASEDPVRARLLIADDNADMRQYLTRLLSDRYAVTTVSDGAQALAALREPASNGRFNLVLTDVMMPELDGFGLLRALRSDDRTAAVPVIMLSARAGEEATIEGIEAGVDEYLVKPFTARELLARVRTTLELARVRQGLVERERLWRMAEEARIEAETLTEQLQMQTIELEGQTEEAQALAAELQANNQALEQTLLAVKAARDAADSAQRQITSVLDGMVDGYLCVDREWRITTINRTAALGRPRPAAEIIGTIFWEEWPDTVGTDVEHHYRHVMETGTAAHFEYRYAKPDEQDGWVEIDVYPAQHGGLSLFYRDITQRKRAEEALRASEAEFHLLADSMPQLAWTADASGWIYWYNQRWYDYTGTTAKDMEGWGWQSVHDPAELPRVMERWQASIQTGEPFDMEFPLRGHDGRFRWFLTRVLPVRDPEGRPIRWFGTNTDVTAERENAAERERLLVAERAARTATEAANMALTEQAHVLETTTAQLLQAQKMESVGQLAGGIAHDFNNLLTVIIASMEFVSAEIPADNAVQRDLQEISGAVTRATTLIRQLLTFSRRQVVQPSLLDLNDVIERLLPILRRLIPEDIFLTPALARVPAQVWIDPGQFEQVLINLIVNARDAMPHGGTLTIATIQAGSDDASRERSPDMTPGKSVRLVVSDTGIGMDAVTQSRIFEPFFTTKEKDKGTGLGLSSVYGIITQAGGQISVDSEIGRGTRFSISLPCAQGTVEAHTPAASPPTLGGSETLLLVEDDPAIRMLTGRLLRKAGYTVLEAANGAQALQLFQQHGDTPIALIISDLVMPEMRGPELADRVRALCPEIKLLFMSGYAEELIPQQGQAKLSARLLEKPFTQQTLKRVVREVLDSPVPPFSG